MKMLTCPLCEKEFDEEVTGFYDYEIQFWAGKRIALNIRYECPHCGKFLFHDMIKKSYKDIKWDIEAISEE